MSSVAKGVNSMSPFGHAGMFGAAPAVGEFGGAMAGGSSRHQVCALCVFVCMHVNKCG